MPSGMELMAEIGHPVLSEGTSANLIMLLLQLFETALTAFAAHLTSAAMNVVMLGGIGGAALLAAGVHARYRRMDQHAREQLLTLHHPTRASSFLADASGSLLDPDEEVMAEACAPERSAHPSG